MSKISIVVQADYNDVEEYDNYLQENNLPHMSADELIYQMISDNESLTSPEQKQWLNDFIVRWEQAEGDSL